MIKTITPIFMSMLFFMGSTKAYSYDDDGNLGVASYRLSRDASHFSSELSTYPSYNPNDYNLLRAAQDFSYAATTFNNNVQRPYRGNDLNVLFNQLRNSYYELAHQMSYHGYLPGNLDYLFNRLSNSYRQVASYFNNNPSPYPPDRDRTPGPQPTPWDSFTPANPGCAR